MNLIGVFGALLIGVVLGLIGAGGSILTVPIFVYVLDVKPVLATAYSLFVVGIAAFFGTIKNSIQFNLFRNLILKMKVYFINVIIICVYFV